MVKKTIPLILISLIIAACTTTTAPVEIEIDEKYLTEKTNDDSKNIFAIENRIIETHREKLALEKKLIDQAKLPAETEKELKLLRDENKILKDQISLYEKKKNAANLEAKKTQLKKNEIQIEESTALLQFQQAENKYIEADINLKNAELAKDIAELKFEKSKIAAEYLDKYEITPNEDKDSSSKKSVKKDPEDKYGYKKYSENLDKTEKHRVKVETKYQEAEKKYLDAKAALEKFNS